MQTPAAWFVIVGSLALTPLAAAADPGPLLAKIKAVGKEGAGNVEAASALRELVRLGPNGLLGILAAFDDANPIAANWLRVAVDTIADREVSTDRPLPAVQLEAFVNDTRHNGAARRLAYEWLVRVDATAPQRLLPGMLDDPGQELRRNAVAVALGEAQKLLDPGDNETGRSALKKVFAASRDIDQVERIARKFTDLGMVVDVPAHLGFIQHWHLVGPFDNHHVNGFGVAFPPEQDVDLGRGYPAREVNTVFWREFSPNMPAATDLNKMARVDLNTAIGKHKGVLAYAFAAIESPREQAVEIRAGSPNAIKLFLNSKEIYACEEYHHNGRLDTHVARAVLRGGRNELLVKVCQNEQTEEWAQEWVFQVRICDALGGAVPFTVLPAPPGKKTEARVNSPWWMGWGLGTASVAAGWFCFRSRVWTRLVPRWCALNVKLLPWLLPLAACSALAAGDWAQFRGPGGAGTGEEIGLPVVWSIERHKDTGAITASKNVRWVVDLPGRGLSSPVVAGGRVYVTTCTGYRQTRLRILCYDAESGRKVWERQLAATGNTACQAATSMAAPTPVSDGERVCAMFASGDLACFDKDGNLQWYRSLVGDYPAVSNTTGMAASPVPWQDVLIVPLENAGESFTAGIDVRTGRNRWKIERSRANNWVTPLLVPRDERTEVLLQSAGAITAHDPATGELRWSFKGKNLSTIPSPTLGNGVVFAPGEELIALRPGTEDQAPEVLWRAARLAPKSATPLVYGDRVFTLSSAGVLNCADTATGRIQWQKRLRGGFWASPVAADGKVFCVNAEGTAFAIAAERGEILGTNPLGETIFATPALAAGAIFLRSDQHLYCFSTRQPQ